MKGIILSAFIIFLAVVIWQACSDKSTQTDTVLASKSNKIDFNYQVKPILSDKCFACHGPDEKKRDSGLRLDTEEGAFMALKSDPHTFAIVRGNPEQSMLVKRIFSEDPTFRMPPAESNLVLTEEEKNILKRWIEQGAEYKKHWAFIPPQKAKLPEKQFDEWGNNEIDRFIGVKLKEHGFSPSKPADKERLIRRVSFDLTGLPPSLEQMDAFLKDESPQAYEKMVDQLLASTAYGERWANYWLDVARYGDSHGYQDDLPRIMWPWRDWVIHAFNKNLPYDQFVTWQLAGDLLPDATKEQILASGFNRNHKITQEGGVIPEEYRTEYVADRTNTFGKAFLGMSVECSRCHDHKYDPILQKDFFSIYAFFNKVKEKGLIGYYELPKPSITITQSDLKDVLKFVNGSTIGSKDTVSVMVMSDDEPRKTFVLNRGEYDKPTEVEVKPSTPAAIMPFDSTVYGANRLGLTKWLFDARNPLTSRVMVNRLWQEMFGRGIVATSEDFGNQGTLPSHPELLDYLAVDFREHGWDIKYLLKKMVMSATYQQSSATSKELREKDPDNVWLARSARYRLNGEMIRDNVLFTSGLLNPEIGGPSVKPYQPEGIWEAIAAGRKDRGEMGYIQDNGPKLYRRSLYTYWRKTIPPPSMLIFDAAMKEICEVRRVRTSTPLQALNLLNDPQILEASRVLGSQLLEKHTLSTEQKIEQAFRKIVSRRPTEKEVEILMDGYTSELSRFKAQPLLAKKFLNVGAYPQNEKLDPVACAAMMHVVSMIYNLDEAISKS
ncbi:PSD1 and planctomycete cytochrome C domain-containing protein [Rhodocytophaga aerolata]|uniref:PSD1 and planctomycete cytochrome C domain-containing protein n=1 Tax=Rhodocytophaga aerolata TaxID=455078 RepID=A0ABT8R410_9BACT|nr:PSD1 and planctomycete cytochrome C domain-containing protein [Rhodocytophaga aerolata]MDO1445482.1 PSD1 and planctomycete cytochrome C domain-containing protein [Rhodocytophaga aerolata]